MTTPTREQVEALLALEAKATPGDWFVRSIKGYTDDEIHTEHPDYQIKPHGSFVATVGLAAGHLTQKFMDDSAFIAAARNLIRPLAEAYQRRAGAIKMVQVETLKGMREPLIDVLTHLIAAHSLLSRSPKKAVPSDKMFDQVLVDYERSIERGREAITELDRRILALELTP